MAGWVEAANAGALAVHYPVNFISATLPSSFGRGYRALTGSVFLTDQQSNRRSNSRRLSRCR
jgi:hypothetical protein